MNFILDNLIASGNARPMIVVMDRGYAERLSPESAATALPAAQRSFDFRTFEDVLVNELIPEIDAHFRTLADRDHRAMAGLSMGAMQTFQIGLKHLDTFSHIGIFSLPPIGTFDTGSSHDGVFRDAAAFNARVHLLWLGAGTAEDRFVTALRDMVGV